MKKILAKDIVLFHCSDLLDKSKQELESLLGKDFAQMKGFNPNNPHHHLSLLEHTVQVAEGLRGEGLCEQEVLELKIAGLFHDVGKKKVALFKNGRTVFTIMLPNPGNWSKRF